MAMCAMCAMTSLGAEFKTDGTIVCGGSRIAMSPSGKITLANNQGDTYDIHLSFSLKSSNKWFTAGMNPPWKNTAVKVDPEAKKSVFSGEVAPEGDSPAVGVEYVLRLDEKGAPEVSLALTSSKPVGETLSLYCVNIHVPHRQIEGHQLGVDGTSFSVAAVPKTAERKNEEFLNGRAKEIVFFSDSADRKVCFKPMVCANAWLRDCRTSDRDPFVELRLSPEEGRVAFGIEVDEKASGLQKASTETYGGVDFWACNRMRMPNYHLSRNLVQNPGFEDGLRYWRFGPLGILKECRTEEYYDVVEKGACNGGRCLRITGIKGESPAHINTFGIPLTAGETYTLSFHAKGDKQGRALSVRGTSFVWPEFPIATSFVLGAEWKRYTVTFKAPNNGVTIGFGLDKPPEDATAWLDAVQLEPGVEATAYDEKKAGVALETASRGFWIQPGEAAKGALRIHAPPNSVGEVVISCADYLGRNEKSENWQFTADAAGVARIELPWLDQLGRGIHLVQTDLRLADGFADRDFHRLVVAPYLDNTEKNKNIFALGFGDSRHGNWQRRIEFWKHAGIGGYINFLGVDPIGFDRLLEENHILKLASITDGGDAINGIDFRAEPDKVAALTDADLAAIEKAAYEKVKARPHIRYWKLINEPPWEYLSKPARLQGLVKAMRAAAKGIRAADPTVKITSPDPSNMYKSGGIRFIDEYLSAGGGDTFDYPAIHPYRPRPENPDLDPDIAAFLDMLATHGYKGDVWFTEGIYHQNYMIPAYSLDVHNACSTDHYRGGTLSYDIGWGERMNAAYTARSWLIALKYADRVKFYADWGFAWNSFIDMDMTPAMILFSANTPESLLGDATFTGDVALGEDARCMTFDDGHGRAVAALWSCDSETDAGRGEGVSIILPSAPAGAELIDFMGVAAPMTGAELKLSPFPAFIRCRAAEGAALRETLACAKLKGGASLSCRAWLQVKTADSLELQIQNITGKPVKASLAVRLNDADVLGKQIDILAGQTWKEPCVPPASAAPGVLKVSGECALKIEGDDGPVRIPVELSWLSCAPSAKPLAIVGDLSMWSGIQPIEIVNVKEFDPSNAELRAKYPQTPALKGPEDLSAKLYTSWDKEALYLAVEVRDDIHDPASAGKPRDAWSGDSLQVYFDCWGDARSHKFKGFDNNDQAFQIKDAGDGKLQVYRDVAPEQQVAFLKTGPVEVSKTAFRRTDDGRSIYEVAIPWKELTPLEPKPGLVFGFALVVNDRDKDYRKRMLTLTPQGTEPHMRPDLFPAMILAP